MADNNLVRPLDLIASKNLLQEMFDEVAAQEGPLSGGKKLGLGSDSLQKLKQTRAVFGTPRDSLIRLTPSLFESVGIELKEIWKRQMHQKYNFYYMTLPVTLQPGQGVQFIQLECSFEFGPAGSDEPIVQALFPTAEWKDVLEWGAGMKIALDGDLSYNVGIDATVMQGHKIPQQIKAKLFNANELRGFITIPDFRYNLGRAETVAGGIGNNFCFWRIQKPSLRQLYDVPFSVVFKVPQNIQNLQLTGTMVAKPSFAWLTANLRDVFEYLSDKLKALLRQRENECQGSDCLPVGDAEQWELHLPE